jgi:hypothetical protein
MGKNGRGPKKLLQRQADVTRRANRLLQRQAARGAVF